MNMAKQLSLFDFGVTAEESCMMCHLSSECNGCCKTCNSDTCNGQICGQPMREYESERLSTWLYLVNTTKDLNKLAHRVLTKRQIKQYKIKQL